MWNSAKRLFPGIALIIAASAVLLLVDGVSLSTPAKSIPSISILQLASRPVLDDCVRGAVDGLKESGFEPGRNIEIRFFNAENDTPTANSMARLVVESADKLAITFSTPFLQIMANVNKAGKKIHLFGAVTDPFAAGVGITNNGHPRHLAGIGTFQPVRETLQLAKKLNPNLKVLGTVWNPGDAAAEACVKLARDECSKLGITLVETQVEASSGVAEASSALASRGIQAFWVGGDNTVELAIDSVIKVARQAKIPLFCNAPSHLPSGAFVAMGADYHEVGRYVGKMAAAVLGGLDPASIKIDNVVPRQLGFNLQAMAGLREKWTPDSDTLAKAAILIDTEGKTVRSQAAGNTVPAAISVTGKSPAMVSAPARRPPRPKPWKFQLLDYADALTTEETHEGIFAELKTRGLLEGRDYELRQRSAHGDVAVLNGIIDAAVSDSPDLVITTSTPTLQVAINKIKKFPVVFTTVTDGVMAGAGTTNESHLPNFTGVNTMSDFEGMVALILECLPGAKSIGTLFVPSEINSVRYRDELVRAAAKRGLSVVSVGVATVSEVSDSANALAAKRPDIIAQVSDNVSNSAFPSIVDAAKKARIPLFGFVSSSIKTGAAAAVARDYSEAGRLAVDLAVRIMGGEDPARIPFTSLSRTQLILSVANAQRFGMIFPESLIRKADKVVQ